MKTRSFFFCSGLVVLSCLSACSTPVNGQKSTTPTVIQATAISETTPRFASGPIANACLIDDRRAANRQHCGCVQAAADLTLSNADQKRSVKFFDDPDLLQQIRQSDDASNERFWTSWKGFVETAEDLCSVEV